MVETEDGENPAVKGVGGEGIASPTPPPSRALNSLMVANLGASGASFVTAWTGSQAGSQAGDCASEEGKGEDLEDKGSEAGKDSVQEEDLVEGKIPGEQDNGAASAAGGAAGEGAARAAAAAAAVLRGAAVAAGGGLHAAVGALGGAAVEVAGRVAAGAAAGGEALWTALQALLQARISSVAQDDPQGDLALGLAGNPEAAVTLVDMVEPELEDAMLETMNSEGMRALMVSRCKVLLTRSKRAGAPLGEAHKLLTTMAMTATLPASRVVLGESGGSPLSVSNLEGTPRTSHSPGDGQRSTASLRGGGGGGGGGSGGDGGGVSAGDDGAPHTYADAVKATVQDPFREAWDSLTRASQGGLFCPHASGEVGVEGQVRSWMEEQEKMRVEFPWWRRTLDILGHEDGAAGGEGEARQWLMWLLFGPVDPKLLSETPMRRNNGVTVPAYSLQQPRAISLQGATALKLATEMSDSAVAEALKELTAAAQPLRADTVTPEAARAAILTLTRLWGNLARTHPGSEKLPGLLRSAMLGGNAVTAAPAGLVQLELSMRREKGYIPCTAEEGVPWLFTPVLQRPGNPKTAGLNRGSNLGALVMPGRTVAIKVLQDFWVLGFISSMEAYLLSKSKRAQYCLATALKKGGVELPYNGLKMPAWDWYANVKRVLDREDFWEPREDRLPPPMFWYPFMTTASGAIQVEPLSLVPLRRADVPAVEQNKLVVDAKWLADFHHAVGQLEKEPGGGCLSQGAETLLGEAPEPFMQTLAGWADDVTRAIDILSKVVGRGSSDGKGGKQLADPCVHCGDKGHQVKSCFKKGSNCPGCKALTSVRTGDATASVCASLKAIQEKEGRKPPGIKGQIGQPERTADASAAKSKEESSKAVEAIKAQAQAASTAQKGAAAPHAAAAAPAAATPAATPRVGFAANRGGGAHGKP